MRVLSGWEMEKLLLSKKNEQAMATAASSSVARREKDGHVLCTLLAQRPHSIISFSH
jgi:hypothetical protein